MKTALEAQGQADMATTKGIAANQQQADAALKDIIEQNHAKTSEKLDIIAKKCDEDDDNLMRAWSAPSLGTALSSRTLGTIAEDSDEEVAL